MLERIAAQILNRYIGRYVENINTENLSIGLLQGAVELENLPLKKDALSDLDIPGISLKSGHIGKVILRIASYKTIKEPWVIEIHRLSLVVGPGDSSKNVDKAKEEKKKAEQKQSELDSLEEKWRAKHGESKSLYSVWYSYSSSIITTIMENLQFETHDVHIRYEDDKTLLPQKYACGVSIKHLIAKSTDENWIPTTGSLTVGEKIFKLLQLNGFSFYWDTDSKMTDNVSNDNTLHHHHDTSATDDEHQQETSFLPGCDISHFVLTPVAGQAKLMRNCSKLPLRSRNQPRISLDVTLGEISLCMGQAQYRQAIALMSELSRADKREQNADGRPVESVMNKPVLWWKWATEIHLKKIRCAHHRSSKSFLLVRARDNVEYVSLYKKLLNSKMELKKLTASETTEIQQTIAEIEDKMSFDEIHLLRDLVYESLDKELKKEEKLKETKSSEQNQEKNVATKSWGSWIGGWASSWRSTEAAEAEIETTSNVDSVSKEKSQVELNFQESVYKELNEDDLYEFLGDELADQDTTDTFLKRDHVLLNLNFLMDGVTLALYEDDNDSEKKMVEPFVGFEFRAVTVTSEWKPRYKSSEIKMDLGGIFISDVSDTKSHYRHLVKPQILNSGGGESPRSPQDTSMSMSSSFKGLFQLLSPNKVENQTSTQDKTPVFSLLYQNQPRTSSNQFTNRLEVNSAPLSITFLPNLVERVNGFFKSKEFNESFSELDDGFSATARETYETWKVRSQEEIRRTVKRIMDGKTEPNVSQDRWAVSLSISAPEVILPERISDAKSNIVIVNLGHMIFKNHNEDDKLSKWKPATAMKEAGMEKLVEDDDDFRTPPDTPPSEDSTSMTLSTELSKKIKLSDEVSKNVHDEFEQEESESQQRLNEKLFYERMYEKYQIHFTDLQVLVAKSDDKWEATRVLGKGPHHLVEKFSVDILMERRNVFTFDSNCPAVKVKGNLPHLTIHISHSKVHSLFNCLDRVFQKLPTTSSSASENKSFSSSKSTSSAETKKQRLLGTKPAAVYFQEKKESHRKTVEEKLKSKQLLCQFSLNQISILLEESPASILSVLDVYRIQTEFTKRPYDHSAQLSIHSLLLADTKQELGHDFELLLASHSNVQMDLGSGNILDSGTVSPDQSVQSKSQENIPTGQHIPNTKNTLSTVAENLGIHQLSLGNDMLGSIYQDFSGSANFDGPYLDDCEDLITFEWNYLSNSHKNPDRFAADDETMQRHKKVLEKSPIFQKKSTIEKSQNFIFIKFNSLDLVLNLKTWVALLDFLHHLKPDGSTPDNVSQSQGGSRSFTKDVEPGGERQLDRNNSYGMPDMAVEGADDAAATMVVFLEFRKLNVLLLRHIELPGKIIGRKVATLTMHNAEVHTSVGDSDLQDKSKNKMVFTTLLDVQGSVGSLGMQDLTNAELGRQVLSLGELLDDADPTLEGSGNASGEPESGNLKTQVPLGNRSSYDDLSDLEQTDAFSFVIRKGSVIVPRKEKMKWTNSDLMFQMDTEEVNLTEPREEVIVNLRLASFMYMHSPRLVAEILALVDEAGEITSAQMASDTRQAYKDMAYSIMDKSIAVLGKSVHQINVSETVSDSATPIKDSESSPSLFKLTVDIQTPIVALPKCYGSYELLVGNLGKITITNDHALNRYDPEQDALDVLHIDVTDMNVTSKRQIEEEVKAKLTPDLKRKGRMKKVPSGPSLAKLRLSSSKSNSTRDTQILHDTCIKLTVVKKLFVPSPRKPLDVRNPGKKTFDESITDLSDEVYDGPIGDKKMCVNVQLTMPLAVTLSKPAYEQVLKTLDHISYGGNIDTDDIKDVFEDDFQEFSPRSKNLSQLGRSVIGSETSQQSTPSHPREFQLFTAPGLEITPKSSNTSKLSIMTQRKYTPLSADVSIPCLILQLNEDLSEGEQGVVKVTLERFSAKFEKENRSTTHLDLTLGSVDVEDLLKKEDSPHRHIVVSYSRFIRDRQSSGSNQYLSSSCPGFIGASTDEPGVKMSTSLPSTRKNFESNKMQQSFRTMQGGVFRPFDAVELSSGPFGSCQATHDYQTKGRSRTASNEYDSGHHVAPPSEKPLTPPCSPCSNETPNFEKQDETLVRIQAFLVDGKSLPYEEIYSRTNRRINIDFNSLDCKINLQTWVVLLDFFGIGTSPNKTYNLDPRTEEKLNWDRRLAVSSYYENQPDDHINSEIDFKVRSFSLIFNKEEYEFVKANISKFETHVRIRDGVLGVSGQLGSLSVSDLSPNGVKYKERFVFAGQKAMDFDIEKYDDYDYDLEREYDIRVKLRMSAICYIHTQRFQQELIAYLLHFQQLQEVLGRMRAASVGQTVRDASCRQARVSLDIKASSPVILLPESSHSDRLIVADLGRMTVQNSFKRNGSLGTLSHNGGALNQAESRMMEAPLSPGSKRCLLDVLHADLEQMDLFTAFRTDNQDTEMKECSSDDKSKLIFSSFIVTRDLTPLLKEKLQLSLQIERNLEKETVARTVPDTSVSGQMSSVYCTVDLTQYWLVRGILDHNLGEPIPEFPQPTAFLQPSTIQTVLSGSVYTGMSVDMHLSNVSVELLERHETTDQKKISLARLDYVKSRLSYRSYSDQTKTVNLSCEAFVASDTRWAESAEDIFHKETRSGVKRSVFATVFGPTTHTTQLSKKSKMKPSNLQFELQYRAGPDFMYFTALLVEMRVYLIIDWLSDVYKYIIVNPAQPWCDSLRAKAAELLEKYGQIVPGQEQQEDDPDKRDTQFKINVTNTDFVLVENCSRVDSDAVILRSTAVLHHHPKLPPGVKRTQELNQMKIMTCTLQSIEVFSCQLDCENETALSIVDPVTINIEVDSLQQRSLTNDEINFDLSLLDKNKLDIHISELNTRISYNDLLLFLAIAKALPLKKEETSAHKQEHSSMTSMKAVFKPSQTDISRLAELGYARDDIVRSLQYTGGSVEHSAEWLLQNAKVQSETLSLQSSTTTSEKSEIPFDIGKIFLHVDSACVCLIDDCAENCDVPLAELALRSLTAEQNLSPTRSWSSGTVPTCYAGKANLVLTGDYYNRMLSLWEPYLEQWRCGFKWNYLQGHTASSAGRWDVKVQAPDRLDISVTSTLIETVKKTMDTWTTSFNRSSEGGDNLIDLGFSASRSFSRKRQPFIPYVLRNLTGLPLRFATHISAMQNLTQRSKTATSSSYSSDNREELWIEVMPNESYSVQFQRAEKQRHKRSDKLILHQIVVKVGEWETLSPVTISKVGVYFRHADREINKSSHVYRSSDPVRVVFAVTLEGSAQKVVTVRSALVIRSKVKIPIQIHLEQNDVDRPLVLPSLEPGGVQYIPLELTNCGMKIKPVFSSKLTYRPCSQSIQWKNMKKDSNYVSDLVTCQPEQRSSSEPFRFSVCMKKKPYPSYEEVAEKLLKERAQKMNQDEYENTTQYNYIPPHMPGHTIVVLPPVVVSNLLPCDLHYYFKNTEVAGKLSPGQDATLHTLHLAPGSQNHPPLLLGCDLEGFNDCRELNISHIEKDSQMRMVMVDHHGRNLILNVRIFWRLGCSVKISVMSGYWIVNKTGLPIVVKQDGARYSSAGQYEEHERARSITPLMFSYSDRDLPYLCTMRLGKKTEQGFMQSKYPHESASSPSYCQSFSIDGGTCTRNLLMINHDNRPNRVYYIGLSVRRGWGRYRHTHIVTVAPRFLLVNLTRNHTLSFAQHHATSFTQDSTGLNQHLTIISGSSIVFHWPRADLDRLLCARLTNEKNCRWSGGFIIDRIDAFHINLRLFGSSKAGSCSIFLRVEITLVDATYRVSFYDGDISSCPSPLRFDNISPAPLVLKQVDTDDGLTIDVAPESQVSYACDEPCLPPLISCMVKGGSSSVILNMDNIGLEKLLYYENYIYIVVGQSASVSSLYHQSHVTEKEFQLVLEVEQVHYDQSVDGTGHLVKLGRRRAGKRNQLWRMTSEGLLIHEGSSPPTVGQKNKFSSEQSMVLDIAEMQMGKEDILPLTIRRADQTRKSQHWKFTEEGRLCNALKNLCVQVSQSNRVGIRSFTEKGIVTPNQYCTSEKMIAGSGVLALKVVRDGPTRVIRIVDIRQKRAGILTVKSAHGGWSLVGKNHKSHQINATSLLNPEHESKVNSQGRMMLSVDMTKGVGVSLVNNLLEELLYLTMSGVRGEATFAEREQSFSLSIHKIQIDNQLFGGFPPVMLFPYKSSTGSGSTSQESTSTDPNPALTINAVKIPSSNSLYEIYNSLAINIGRICLQLEERLILKLYQFFGSDISSETDQSLLDETKMDLIQNMPVTKLMNSASKRYYFDSLKFHVSTMQLSVFTASKLDPELQTIKQSASLVLIQFERAPVVMQAYERKHVFESVDFILDEAGKHFTDQLKGQAAKILGSVDFLGNPLGLISDVRAGVGSLARGSVPSLVKHLTHGLSDSAAKVTGTLSAISGGITMDQDHEEKRRMIRANSSNPSDHLVSGLHGLATGLVGGLTSIVTQTVRGTADDGAKGFFTGFGKGLIGTVTKPVTGVLDFASETASFVRDSSISSNHSNTKVRLPRTSHSFQGCLEPFSVSNASHQLFLHSINGRSYDEWLYSVSEIVMPRSEKLLVLITNKRLYLTKHNDSDPDGILLQADYYNLVSAQPHYDRSWYIEITMKMGLSTPHRGGTHLHYSSSSGVSSRSGWHGATSKKPKILCHSESVAKRICEHINYANMLASEQSETLPSYTDDTERDKAFDLEV